MLCVLFGRQLYGDRTANLPGRSITTKHNLLSSRTLPVPFLQWMAMVAMKQLSKGDGQSLMLKYAFGDISIGVQRHHPWLRYSSFARWCRCLRALGKRVSFIEIKVMWSIYVPSHIGIKIFTAGIFSVKPPVVLYSKS